MPDQLGAVLGKELSLYGKAVTDGLNRASEKAVKNLAKKTRASAPVGKRGRYRRSITYKLTRANPWGNTYTWYVKPPDHRLTHLLVHGHPTRNGGRTRGSTFLQDALSTVVADYLRDVEEVARRGG